MKRLILSSLFAAILTLGCEHGTDTVRLETYEETLMVQSYIDAGHPIRIQVTRTIPPLEKWSIERAEVTDATVRIDVDGIERELAYVGKGIYTDPALRGESGKRYRLTVRQNEREVTGSTLVPFPTAIDSYNRIEVPSIDACLEDGITLIYRGECTPRPENAFFPRLDLESSRRYAFPSFGHLHPRYNGIARTRDTNGSGILTLNLGEYCVEAPLENGSDTLMLELFVYDVPFYDYLLTRNAGSNRDDVLETSGTEVSWNVEGDGIGYVIGRAVYRDTVVF